MTALPPLPLRALLYLSCFFVGLIAQANAMCRGHDQ